MQPNYNASNREHSSIHLKRNSLHCQFQGISITNNYCKYFILEIMYRVL